jgi:hypothetical protein
LPYEYKFFGLVFHSNLQLPGIPLETNTPLRWDVVLHVGLLPHPQEKGKPVEEELTYVSSDTNEKGEPTLKIWKNKYGSFVRMAYDDGTQFWLDDQQENIWATWPETSSLEEACTYLLGPVLGLLLRLRGITCLHASAVNLRGRGIAFLGAGGAGKSTTAAAFAREGYAVLSDDIVALEERDGSFLVMPAYPQVSLWPESVNMVYGSPNALPRFTPNWEKRCLALGQGDMRFESRPLPLAAVYILGDRRAGSASRVEAVSPQPALLSLVADTYANKVLDRKMRAREFEVLGRLVETIPIRRLDLCTEASRLHDLCRVIEEDLARLG